MTDSIGVTFRFSINLSVKLEIRIAVSKMNMVVFTFYEHFLMGGENPLGWRSTGLKNQNINQNILLDTVFNQYLFYHKRS